ncbi:MAG: ABC transporter [Dehalococcoidia bacterium]|nr:ABC transporter [Dehalococcoidia bacterium]
MSEVFTGFWVIAHRELLRLLRERARLVSTFAIPIFTLIIFGAGFNRIVTDLDSDVDLVQFMFPGVVCMGVAVTCMFAGLSVVWDREFGFLKMVLVAPLNRIGVALGKAAGGAAVATVQGLIILAFMPVVGLSLDGLAFLKLFLVLILMAATLSCLGILVASRMRSQQGFHGVVEMLLFPLLFFSGIFFPVDRVPTWLGVIAKLNPITYGVDAARQVVLESQAGSALAGNAPLSAGNGALGVTVFGHTMAVWEDALVLAAFGVVVVVTAAWSFSRQE